jgi:hypothetical protein
MSSKDFLNINYGYYIYISIIDIMNYFRNVSEWEYANKILHKSTIHLLDKLIISTKYQIS